MSNDEQGISKELKGLGETLYTEALKKACIERGYPHVSESNEKLAEAIEVIEKIEVREEAANKAKGEIAKFAAEYLRRTEDGDKS